MGRLLTVPKMAENWLTKKSVMYPQIDSKITLKPSVCQAAMQSYFIDFFFCWLFVCLFLRLEKKQTGKLQTCWLASGKNINDILKSVQFKRSWKYKENFTICELSFKRFCNLFSFIWIHGDLKCTFSKEFFRLSHNRRNRLVNANLCLFHQWR